MFENVPLLKCFSCIQFEDDSNKWIRFQAILDFLRKNHLETDSIKEIKRHNLLREMKSYKNSIREADNEIYVNLSIFIRYIFHHCDQLKIYLQIVHQIEAAMHSKPKKQQHAIQVYSVEELYKHIAAKQFRLPAIDNILKKDQSIDNHYTPCLFQNYEDQFSDNEWQNICFFEYHFSKLNQEAEFQDYDQQLDLKWQFLKQIESVAVLAKSIKRSSNNIIKYRNERKHIAETDEKILVYASKIHIAARIENELCTAASEDVENVLIFDCASSCTHQQQIHIFAEVKSERLFKMADVISTFKIHVENRHNLLMQSIVFLRPNTLTPISEGSDMSRFDIRDLYMMNKLDEHVITEHIFNDDQEVENVEEEGKCDGCFQDKMIKPLHWKSFNIIQEWTMDVPLDVQILLETFLNQNSLNRSNEIETLISSKLKKLYGIYDTLLNVYNRNYCGILQELNTQELSMNYQSIGTAFSIASSSGATLSLNAAEKKVKEKASADMCYFNTYVRRYQLEYNTVAGFVKNYVSLRQCLLVLMMDNLVRLKHHTDPNPGESRSMQICTLPITLRGVPKDHIDVQQTWHTDHQCDQSDDCKCREDNTLLKEDVHTTLLSLSAEEDKCIKQFRSMMTWGLDDLWRNIMKENTHLLVCGQEESTQNSDSALEDSFATLDIEDHTDANSDSKSVDEIEEEMEMELSGEESDNTVELDYEEPESNSSDYDQEENLEDILNQLELSNIPDEDYEDLEQYFTPLDDSVDLTPIPENPDSDLHLQEQHITELGDNQIMNEIADSSTNEKTSDFDTHQNSTNNNSSIIDKSDISYDRIAGSFGFKKYNPPTLLTRHPPPATGRDDDIVKLKEVLDDILIKTDKVGINAAKSYRILFGADNTIGANLLKLMSMSSKYKIFIPEYPILHLKKSKINNICSGYKHAGIIQILKYMRDEEYNEWKKLISADHIEKASRYIRRLSIALRISFLVKFIQTLQQDQKKEILSDLQQETHNWKKWELLYNDFLAESKRKNATFLLHYEMMEHCEEVSALSLAERIGGHQGYNLMLATVKLSLPFDFLNGASSYAAYTTQLLYEHCKCGVFYQNMKESLFTAPHKDSALNFGLDTQREMDHRDALKAFRSGATMSSVMPRMSLIDSLNEAHEHSTKNKRSQKLEQSLNDNTLGLAMNDTDFNYILRISSLILRQGGLSTKKDDRILNFYSHPTVVLPEAILDANTMDVGQFLIWKYVSSQGLFCLSKDDCPDVEQINGPKEIIRKLKTSKGTTIQRVGRKLNDVTKKERDKKEVQRKKLVAKQTKLADQKSSEMNACQAILKPDCSKPKVQKSTGIQKALLHLLKEAMEKLEEVGGNESINMDRFILFGQKTLPAYIVVLISHVTVEFAGVKFKTRAHDGKHYLKFVEDSIINRTISQMPQVKRMVICEEKYSFTPDHFKAATRIQRQVNKPLFPITHLKTSEEILSSTTFDKTSLVTTMEGKSLISTFIARNIEQLKFKRDIVIDIDSEYIMEHEAGCPLGVQCHCQKYTTPIRYKFDNSPLSRNQIEKLTCIKQRKGEAEMAQVDWLVEYVSEMEDGTACASIVTSGDIDAVTIHMFALCHLWPRNDNSNYKHPVYIILQKAGSTMDIYNITAILELLERRWNDQYIGIKIAIFLCLGGNDFLPKFYNISHLNVVNTIVATDYLFRDLVTVEHNENNQQKCLKVTFSQESYRELIKLLYCPKTLDSTMLSFEEIRQVTVKAPTAKINDPPRNYALWMPAATFLNKLSLNINCLIKYYLSAGQHTATLPNFLQDGCLLKLPTGEIEYNLGSEASVDSENEILIFPPRELAAKLKNCQLKRKKQINKKSGIKRRPEDTPQKGARKKIQQTSTPKKQ